MWSVVLVEEVGLRFRALLVMRERSDLPISIPSLSLCPSPLSLSLCPSPPTHTGRRCVYWADNGPGAHSAMMANSNDVIIEQSEVTQQSTLV